MGHAANLIIGERERVLALLLALGRHPATQRSFLGAGSCRRIYQGAAQGR